MKLYDSIINAAYELLSTAAVRVYPYDPSVCWTDQGRGSLIMLKDSAYELGGGTLSVNYTCVTTTPGLAAEDAVYVYGKDLDRIWGDVSFARIVILEVDDLGDDEEAYRAIQKMEFVRYHVFPEGYMVRVSSESNQERVRISKKALRKGISFQRVGCSYIKKYKEIPGVRHVRIIFATEFPKVRELIEQSRKVDEITKTLTHILDGLPTDCANCGMKAVCDEVDGMKELHMGRKKTEKKR